MSTFLDFISATFEGWLQQYSCLHDMTHFQLEQDIMLTIPMVSVLILQALICVSGRHSHHHNLQNTFPLVEIKWANKGHVQSETVLLWLEFWHEWKWFLESSFESLPNLQQLVYKQSRMKKAVRRMDTLMFCSIIKLKWLHLIWFQKGLKNFFEERKD